MASKVLMGLAVAATLLMVYLYAGGGFCTLLHGKNICNYYEAGDLLATDGADFEKVMSLCQGMDNVPKKDDCFLLVTGYFSAKDTSKARAACGHVSGFENLHTKEECLRQLDV